MEGRRLPDMNTFPFIIGKRCYHSGLGGQPGPDGLPAMENAFLPEFPLNTGYKMIGKYANEKMPFHARILVVTHWSQSQLALECAEGFLYLSQHHVK